MTRIYFKDMTLDQLRTVFNNCRNVHERCMNLARDDAQYYLEDILYDVPKACDYTIGTYCQGEHFSICDAFCFPSAKDIKEVKDWIESNDDLCCAVSFSLGNRSSAFWDDVNKSIRYLEVMEDYSKNVSEKDEAFMNDHVRKTKDWMESEIYSALIGIYENYSCEESALSMFQDYWCEEYFDDYYLEDGNIIHEVHHIDIEMSFC